MEQEKIIVGNKIIAEFIGMTQGRINDKRWACDWFDDNGIINGHRNEVLLFHSSWNWLIPVVEKIATIGNTHIDIHISTVPSCKVGKYKHAFEGSLIENLWESCVDFITEHNNQNK